MVWIIFDDLYYYLGTCVLVVDVPSVNKITHFHRTNHSSDTNSATKTGKEVPVQERFKLTIHTLMTELVKKKISITTITNRQELLTHLVFITTTLSRANSLDTMNNDIYLSSSITLFLHIPERIAVRKFLKNRTGP